MQKPRRNFRTTIAGIIAGAGLLLKEAPSAKATLIGSILEGIGILLLGAAAADS